MATTFTLFVGVWSYVYLLQVGDSRHYVLHGGELHQTNCGAGACGFWSDGACDGG
jgi:serine/threonine protein phosphatase PrpC